MKQQQHHHRHWGRTQTITQAESLTQSQATLLVQNHQNRSFSWLFVDVMLPG